MLVELPKMERRYDAVLGVIRDGCSSLRGSPRLRSEPPERARLAGPPRERRAPGPGRPVPPSQILPPPDAAREVGGRVLESDGNTPPGAGPLRPTWRRRGDPTPALASAVYGPSCATASSSPRRTARSWPTFKGWERGRPVGLWQMDVVGGVLLEDGTECKVLTGGRERPIRYSVTSSELDPCWC